MPRPREHHRLASELTSPRATRTLLEDLVDTVQTALAELRNRNDRRHAALIAELEALHTLAQRELRYRRGREHAAAQIGNAASRWHPRPRPV